MLIMSATVNLILWKIIKIVANRRHIATVARGDTPSIFP